MKLFAAGLTAAAWLIGTGCGAAPVGTVDPARLSEHIRILASDAFEGRGPATPGEDKTVAYVSGQMKALGLAPAGDDGGWTQAVPLRRFVTPGPITVSFTLAGTPRALAELNDIVVHTEVPADHVAVKDAPLVFIGYGVDAPERQWDDFKGYDLKGKIAVVLINDPDFEMNPGDPLFGRFDGKAMTLYGRWTYKYAEAARRGALGVLIVHETAPAAYGWNTVKNSNSNAQFDIVRAHPEALHPLIEGWIQRDVAVELFKAAGLDFDAEKARARTLAFRPVELKAATFSADYAVQTSTIVSHNVIGKIAGTRRPGEAVLYVAHWDHLGVGAPDARGDRIYNGAVDNASGVAGVLELARLFSQAPRPERSVYFIAFTAEEKGLLGSEYYAAHPVTPLATTVGLLNLDVMNVAGPSRDISTRGKGDADLDGLVARFAREQGRTYRHDPHLEEGSFYRADHFSLAKAGLPALTLTAGVDLANGGVAAGEAAHRDYITHRYHQPADEWSADWNLGGAAQDLDLYFALGQYLANSHAWPSWPANSEFKAARDETAAERKP
ncbi:MAG: peptidase [Caulobacteraceae bacterium]|nr:peptidase [Caulobacteraceae bacterium]